MSVVGEDYATGHVVGADRLSGVDRSYIVQEEDGVSRIPLEEGGGFLYLEESAGFGAGVVGEPRAVAVVEG